MVRAETTGPVSPEVPGPEPSQAEVGVRVELGARGYEVRVVTGSNGLGRFARAALDATWGGRSCRRALLVTDANVAGLAPSIVAGLAEVGINATLAVVPPGEPSKSLDRAADLYDDLVRLRADRHIAIVALGGGVVGDLAGFVAATYARGLPLLMVPTSLLSMVDSSVGGKVGVNHPRAKNIIGAFHQPVGVWIDTAYLQGLPPRELRCGLAEVIKYGVILDPHFFTYLEQNAESISTRDPAAMRTIVAHSCRLKADVVARDEREETGLRAILNFGHTIGHAVEAVAGHGYAGTGAVPHGEAVAIGMAAEARLAERLGWIAPDLTGRLVALIERFGLPAALPDGPRPRRPHRRDDPRQEEPARADPVHPAAFDGSGRADRRADRGRRPPRPGSRLHAQGRATDRSDRSPGRMGDPRVIAGPMDSDADDSSDDQGDADVADLVRLLLVPGVGPQTCRALIERFGSAGAVFEAPLAQVRAVAGVGPRLAGRIGEARDTLDAEAELDRCHKSGVRLVPGGDRCIPRRWRRFPTRRPCSTSRDRSSPPTRYRSPWSARAGVRPTACESPRSSPRHWPGWA